GVSPRVRLDKLLVDKALLPSREKAIRSILAGEVLVDGRRVDKAGALVEPASEIEIRGRSPYVSRGGEKLAHALDEFGTSIRGRSGARAHARDARRGARRRHRRRR